MASSETDFHRLMQQIREGSPEALEQVCRIFSDHIRRVVRRHLQHRLRSQYDSGDFLQAVWASFVAVPPERYTFETPQSLIRYLARLACNKVIDVYRQRTTLKNDADRNVPGTNADVLPARQPTPSQIMIADERLQEIIESLTPGQKQIVLLLRQGHTHEEIASQLGVSVKAIQRMLRRLEQRLKP